MKQLVATIIAVLLLGSNSLAIDASRRIDENRTDIVTLRQYSSTLLKEKVKTFNGTKAAAYGCAMVGGLSVCWGLVSLLSRSEGPFQNESLIGGAVLLGLSIPLTSMAQKQDQKREGSKETAYFYRPAIQRNLSFVANRNSIGLALNF